MFTQEVADAICAGLAEGKSLRAVCRADGMPAPSTVIGWLDDPEKAEFAEHYAIARARAYQMLADEIIEISDDSKGDVWIDDEGNERTDAERVARSKLRVDTRKWILAKMLPKVYGDKLDLNHSGRIASSRELSDDELARIAASSGS